MKNIGRLLAALALILVLLFNTVSCGLVFGPGGDNGQNENTDFYIDSPLTVDLKVGETHFLSLVCGEDLEGEIVWTSSSSCASVKDGLVTALAEGTAVIKATLGNKVDRVIFSITAPTSDSGTGDTDVSDDGNSGDEGGGGGSADGGVITLPGTEDPVTSDPYIGVDEEEFYRNYTPAISYMDAYYRTKHNLMSGTIEDQDQAPTISSYRPTSGKKYIRNNQYIFSEDGNTYYVVDCYGEISFEIYKGGAYITLEEVAAYVFAFGQPPANQVSSKKTEPGESVWGEYLRVNHSKFSGSTTKYPYEPSLPRISGCGGDLTYYEMDIGTTGTDCDPGYDIQEYNNGYYITRGAARIVYSCKDRNGNKIIDLDERYVFYTYNHYNDFQEYLNYEGGWGEMFGNITGGGTLSSKYDYNPTPYVEAVRGTLSNPRSIVVVYYYVPKSELVA